MSERCPLCGHALSMHNSQGYCRARSKSKGECPCDSTGVYIDLERGEPRGRTYA